MYPQEHPLITLSSGLSTEAWNACFLHILVHFNCSLKWNFSAPQVHFFIESFCALLCPNKCTNMCIFKQLNCYLKCTLNLNLQCTLYRSQSTPSDVALDEPSVISSIAPTNALSIAPSSATSNASFFLFHIHLQLLVKINSKMYLQVQH